MFGLLLKLLMPYLAPMMLVLAQYEVWFSIPGEPMEFYSKAKSKSTAEKVARALRSGGFDAEVRVGNGSDGSTTGSSTAGSGTSTGGSSSSTGGSGTSPSGSGTSPSGSGTSPSGSGNTSSGGNSGPLVDDPYVHLVLGNPSGATANVANENNYLMKKNQYALAYSRENATPNWVSWHLDKNDLGGVDRSDSFRPDPTLPKDWYKVTDASYKGSGFTRGHMIPSGDRTKTNADNQSVFVMTNMIPQSANNNNKAWNSFEVFCRDQTAKGNELYIICGPYGEGGTGTSGKKTTIDKGRIKVPSHTWKIAVIMPSGSNDLSRINAETRVIALWMPNDQSVGNDWAQYRTSVDFIEEKTGYDFLNTLPTSLQATLESRVDKGPTK